MKRPEKQGIKPSSQFGIKQSCTTLYTEELFVGIKSCWHTCVVTNSFLFTKCLYVSHVSKQLRNCKLHVAETYTYNT